MESFALDVDTYSQKNSKKIRALYGYAPYIALFNFSFAFNKPNT